MAMDALKNISSNVPDWLQRLGELSGQIEQRQLELVALGEADKAARSIRNRGSNESLLKKDDDEVAHPNARQDDILLDSAPGSAPPNQPTGAGVSSTNPAVTSTELKQQTQRAMAVAQAHARAQVRKRHRSQSIVSVEGNPAAYRSRSMIIVYYDSYVESFFEELVKFVSASRNLMRKAKMAAKVAQIKKLAELDNQDDDDDDDDDPNAPSTPAITQVSQQCPLIGTISCVCSPRSEGYGGEASDFYDKLDKGLEYVQSMCERAAHQFLRDGDCNEEIGNISRRLGETKELADKEMERIKVEEPELASETLEAPKFRTHRPPAVRRDLSSMKDPLAPVTARDARDVRRAGAAAAVARAMALEVGVLEPDDDLQPKIVVGSTALVADTDILEVDPKMCIPQPAAPSA
ncbi:unnamed protein product [Parascedosporium putredinis]|uniref:Uncharacterized protein n=1 Tax=Parascedosporium putredinis TaxID=1442378 RepID=A0A9P1GV45_9PEZI|nr:unnamed protein product [Parascedosporium putredinis]CAI7987930.1 unnamed protein product [Parascedosporium putredinis]